MKFSPKARTGLTFPSRTAVTLMAKEGICFYQALDICVKEMVPSIIPNTSDDFLIQMLLMIIFKITLPQLSSKEKRA